MTYRELEPPPELRSHVACLWVRSGPGSRVVPDGCADLVWTGDDLIVAGPSTRAFVADVDPAATKVGVRFRVGAAGPALGLPACELLDASPRAADLWPRGDELTERVGGAASAAERLRTLAYVVASGLRDADPIDPVVRGAVHEVTRPRARVAELAAGIGERQLRRRFDAAVGYAPKTLAGILRLQRFLALARTGTDPFLASLAFQAGYADQAHLTRECRRLTGLTPAALVAEGVGPAGEPALH